MNQQTTLEQRRQQAQETVGRLDLSLPLLLEKMDNRASVAFAARPEEAREQLVTQLERS